MIVIYVLLNAIFLATTPAEELKGQLEVALIAGKHIFGENGGRFAGASHLSRSGCRNQFDDVDRATRDHVDGRRSLVAAMAWRQK